MLSCGSEPPVLVSMFGENDTSSGDPVFQTPSGFDGPSHAWGLGVGVFSTTPPAARSTAVIVCVCCGVSPVVRVTDGVPSCCPMTVLSPCAGPEAGVPQCMGTRPCRLGNPKVVIPSPPNVVPRIE